MVGKVKWFNDLKGYGFINIIGDEEEDIFVHYTNIIEKGFKSLAEIDFVIFDLKKTEKGLQAINVRKKLQISNSFLY